MPNRNDPQRGCGMCVPAFGGWALVLVVLGAVGWFGAVPSPPGVRPGAADAPFAQVGHDDLEAPIRSLAFAPDDTRLAFTTMAGELWVKHRLTGESVCIGRASEAALWSIAFSSDGRVLAAPGSAGAIRLWDLEERRELEPLKIGREPIKTLAFAPDGTRLAVASWSDGAGGGQVAVWDRTRCARLDLPVARAEVVSGLAFSSDGALLAAGGLNGFVTLWDLKTGVVRSHFGASGPGGGNIAVMAFSPSGSLLATATFPDGPVRLWDVPRGQPRGALPATPPRVSALAFSPGGMLLAVAREDGTAALWGMAPLQERGTIRATRSPFEAVGFSHDGQLVATGGRDGAVRLWSVAQALGRGSPNER